MIHTVEIPVGTKGEISKITEELCELEDAHNNIGSRTLTVIEAADIIEAVGQFSWNKTRVPLFAIILIAYFRRVFKPVRNAIRDLLGMPKTNKADG